MVYEFEYNTEKNIKLKQTRNITFDEIIDLIQDGLVLDIIEHHNKEKYPSQEVYVLDIDGYVWFVPYIREGNKVFLKTAFPSRKETKKYFGGENEEI